MDMLISAKGSRIDALNSFKLSLSLHQAIIALGLVLQIDHARLKRLRLGQIAPLIDPWAVDPVGTCKSLVSKQKALGFYGGVKDGPHGCFQGGDNLYYNYGPANNIRPGQKPLNGLSNNVMLDHVLQCPPS